MVRPNSSKDLVDSHHLLKVGLDMLHHSFRIHRNKPLFSPLVYCSVVKLSGYSHAYGIKGIAATDENKKFH